MTPHQPDSPLKSSLARTHRRVRLALATRHGLRAATGVIAVIVLAVALGSMVALAESGSWIRLIAVLAAAGVAIAVALSRFRREAPGFDTYLERVEQSFPEVRSWLRNALDFETRPVVHTSRELADAITHQTARRIESLPVVRLTPRIEPRTSLLVTLGAVVAVVVLGIVAPTRVTRSWNTLLNPALAAPPVQLAVEPGSVRVTPGSALAVRARVWGSTQRPTLHRDRQGTLTGEEEGVAPDGARIWRFDLTQLTRPQDYKVRVARVESPRYHIALAGEPMPVSFEIEYRAPAYARLPVQRGTATRGDLSALRGTRATVEVTFDRDLSALEARLPGGASTAWTEVTARRWRGTVQLDREGEYELAARAESGGSRHRYRIQPLADAPPVLAVRTPGGDLDLPAGQQVPLEIIGQDDLGLSELRLQYRKDPAAPWTTLPLATFAGRPREAAVSTRWDASSLALLPGETATFRFELLDDNAVSGRGKAVSPTFELRFPSLADLYDHLDETQGGAQKSLEKVVEQAREVQKTLDKLSRQPVRNAPESTPAFERSEELQTTLQRQQELAAKIDEASQQLRQSLEQAAERKAFDEELMRKLREMSQLMDQIQSKEFREAMRRMQEALERLDKRALEQQLPEWQRENREMLENLQRTIELLKQLREEERFEALAKRAEELKQRQDALNQEHEASGKNQSAEQRADEAKALSEQQKRESDQSEKLSKDARELAKEVDGQQEQEQLEKTAEQIEQDATESQREASESAAEQRSQQARQQGQKASDALQKASESLESMSKTLQQMRAQADLSAVRRAAQDLVSLQRASEGNLEGPAPPRQRADRQTDLSEGVARVADSLYALAQKSPFITPKLAETLGRAIQQLSTSGKDLSTGNRARGEEAGRQGSAALNEAVLELRDTESSMCQQPGTSQGNKPGSMAQKIGDLGERQARLNGQTKQVARRLSEQIGNAAGDREELERMANEQRRLREQLESIQREDEDRQELLGKLDQAQREMKDVEEILERGATDGELEQKQQRILSRLLDAQRSVNRRDFDPERESRAGEEVVARSAPELPADLLRESDRLRLDLLKAESDRYPAQYRAFVEAYLRALNGSRR